MVEVPELERAVLVCDEVGETTFVFDTAVCEKFGISTEDLWCLNKEDIKDLIRNAEGLGTKIDYRDNYVDNLSAVLTQPIDRTVDGSQTESLGILKPTLEEAPEGSMAQKALWEYLHIGKSRLVQISSDLGIEPIVARARNGHRGSFYLSEHIEAIQTYIATAQGDSLTYKPHGYTAEAALAKLLTLKLEMFRKVVADLEIVPLRALGKNRAPGNFYSPEQIDLMVDHIATWESRNLPLAPDEYQSRDAVRRVLGLRSVVLDQLAAELEIMPLRALGKNRNIGSFYSPEEVASMKDKNDLRRRLGKGATVYDRLST